MDFLVKLRNIVRICTVTGGDQAKQVPIQQITFKGKVADTLMVFPYGLYANVSSTDALALLFSIEGNEGSRAAMAYTPQLRPEDLEQDEVAIYHPFTKSFIKFRNNGDIDIDTDVEDASGSININAVNVNVTASGDVGLDATNINVTTSADINMTVTGDVILDATNVDITASGQVDIDAPATNIGVGGAAIARLGDTVSVTVVGGSSAGVATGTITSGGANTSI